MSAETVDLRVLWDAAKVGDHLPYHGGPPCEAISPDEFYCTRTANHGQGQHVATTVAASGQRHVVSVWPAVSA